MTNYTDWNCHLLSGMREGVHTPQETIEALSVLRDHGIDRFCLMPNYTPSLEPVSRFLLRRDLAYSRLLPLLPQGMKTRIAARVELESGLHLVEHLDRLCFTNHNYLALKMPICSYADWIDYELNRLLYRTHIKRLIFTSFDTCIHLYPTDVLEKLTRIPYSVFQFHYHALADADSRAFMTKLLRQNQTVLLGSEINALSKTYFFEFPYYIESASCHMTVSDFQTILRQNQNFWRK